MKWAYLLVNVLTLAGPLARSFEPRIQFWRQWRAIFPAIGITMLFFVAWDAAFTHMGVWGFTDDYLLGPKLLKLPIEELLFFITVPYACMFIYALANHFIRRDWLGSAAPWIAVGLMALAVAIVIVFWGHWYTCTAFGLMFLLLALHGWIFKSPWLGRFFVAYLLSLVPFVIVNGVLTGAVTAEPVVWYDDHENLGLRLITIPLDDFAYGLDLLLMNVGLLEWLQRRQR